MSYIYLHYYENYKNLNIQLGRRSTFQLNSVSINPLQITVRQLFNRWNKKIYPFQLYLI